MSWQEKLLKSFIAKVIGTILLCLFGTCMLVNALIWVTRYDRNFKDDDKNFYTTSIFLQEMKVIENNIFHTYLYHNEILENDFYNIDLYVIDETGTEVNVASAKAECKTCKVVYENEVIFTAKDFKDQKLYRNKLNLSQDSDSNQKVARLKISMVELDGTALYGIPRGLYHRLKEFEYVKGTTLSEAMVNICISAIAFICTFIFMLCAAGHSFKEDGIHQNWFDKLPIELATGICVLFFGISMSLFGIKLVGNMDFEISIGIIIVTLICIYFGLYFLLWCMTFVVRIKAHTLWKGSLFGKIWTFFITALKVIPYFGRLSFLLAIYWLSQMFFIAVSSYGHRGFKLVYFFIQIVLILSILYHSFIIKKIREGVNALASGNLNHRISLEKLYYIPSHLQQMANNLNLLGDGINEMVAKQLKSERLKTELITNVSHDIKTPLTSIINYIDLLQKEHSKEDEEKYIEVLQRQSSKLKKLTEDVIEASKASTGNISCILKQICLKELLEQSLAEFEEKFNDKNLTVVQKIDDEDIMIFADGRLMWRVFHNLLSNIVKYTYPNTRVYIDVRNLNDRELCISFKNISECALNIEADELLERFIRGDESRSTDGSGLGLSIVKSLMEIQKGSLQLSIDGDLFKVELIVLKQAI